MIKNFVVFGFVVLMMIVFSNYIKEGVFDARVAIAMARIEIEEEEAFFDVVINDDHH